MGMAGQEATRQFSQGATNLRQADYAGGLGAAQSLGQFSNQSIAGLSDLFNLGMSPYGAAWSPLQQFGGLVGSPTVLGGGGGGGRSFGYNSSFGV